MRFREYPSAEAFLIAAREFAADRVLPLAGRIDRAGTIPRGLIEAMAERRFFAFERLAESAPALPANERLILVTRLVEEIARVSASAAKLVLDGNLGQVSLLEALGSDALRARYLPKIRSGKVQVAFLFTEPEGGSELGKLKCTATRVEGGFRLCGSKDWISGAEHRELYLVVAGAAGQRDCFGLFLIDRANAHSRRSISISPRKVQLGMRGLGEHRVELNDVFVPDDCVLIPPRKSAIAEIMRNYNLKRCGQAAIAVGLAHAATSAAYAYARVRYPGDQGGLAFQSAAFQFAEMLTACCAAEQMTHWAVSEVIGGDISGVASSSAKLFATETAVDVTNRAIQLCGANGTTTELPLERYLRDARMLTIAGGTSEIQKRTIARRLSAILGAPLHLESEARIPLRKRVDAEPARPPSGPRRAPIKALKDLGRPD
jgi:alkylation response protein AidB-like acyl-CoA dehydrogenase